MSYSEIIINYMKNNKGYIINKVVKDMGIFIIYFIRMVKNNELNKVKRGIYVLFYVFEDEFYMYYLKYQKIIYIGNIVLVFNGMLNCFLRCIECNVLYNYNIYCIMEIDVYRVNEMVYNLGKVFIEIDFGNMVFIYDKERVLCDIFVYDYLDSEVLNYVIKLVRSNKIDYEKFYKYVIKLNVY